MPRRSAFVIPSHWPIQDVAQYKPLTWFIPYERNPRTHPPAQVAFLVSLLQKFGPDQPIVVDEDRMILKGHGRLLASIEGGLPGFTFVQRFGMSATDKMAMRIQDNQSNILGGWSASLIQGELGTLKTGGYDITLLGFPEAQLRAWDAMIGSVPASDPDQAPPVPKVPSVRHGDLWVLGGHRLFCGDATLKVDVAKTLGALRAQMTFTDPPYNVAYQSNRAKGQVKRFKAIENDKQSDENFRRFLHDAFQMTAFAMEPLSPIYVCHPDAASGPKIAFEEMFAKFFQKSATLIWAKNAAGMGFQDYRSQHEPMLYGWKTGKGKHRFFGDRTNTTLWNISRDAQASYVHPTQKPVALVTEAIVNSSRKGDCVYEPFAGSFTTGIAAELTGRKCLAIELDPGYVQVGIERWEKVTNQKARLGTPDGPTLEEIGRTRRRSRSAQAAPATPAPARASRRRPPAPLPAAQRGPVGAKKERAAPK